ncbi:MAG: DUF4364 family protein [Clostridia bacterium]|nr:DUF4364 family protein [Clostridia bacterium]
MEQNTFGEGTAPDGLRRKSEIKLLVCYLLKKMNMPLSRTKINEILQEDSIANYFEINQAISDLVKNGNLVCEISEDSDEILYLTPRAYYDIGEIEKFLPRTVREKSVSAALRIIARDKVKSESKVEVTELEKGYHVTFTIEDVGTELLKLTVYVSDRQQIELVKRNFYNNAIAIYSDIISSLTVE